MELQAVRPGDYWLLLGADAMKSFDEWRSPQKVVRLCRLGVAVRPPMTETDLMARVSPEYKEKIDVIRMKPVDISATELRQRIGTGKGLIAPFLSPGVLQYINEHRLYRA
jgi:nicotinate-nucleotide adenylyltransferase